MVREHSLMAFGDLPKGRIPANSVAAYGHQSINIVTCGPMGWNGTHPWLQVPGNLRNLPGYLVDPDRVA